MVPWDVESVSCPKCGCNAERVFLPRSERPENANRFSPVVVFRKRDGTFRFPGRANERTPKDCERVELRDIHQVRKFERDENQRLKDIHQESMARRGANYRAMKKEFREQLKARLGSMSPRARKLAEFAMAQSDARESHSSQASRYDAGFRIDCFSNDRGNRSEFIDADTDWKRKRE
jgi:hypothetical protein